MPGRGTQIAVPEAISQYERKAMKLAAAVAALALVFAAGCDRGAAPRGESGTNTAPVADKSGEKATAVTGGGNAAQAERGSGRTDTNSAGSTTSAAPQQSTGATTR
jgi:hypothetical protein